VAESFDVIIVGAGPAGLKCAETLKDSDLSVLLLEKNPVIGPKVCAGGLTGLADSQDYPLSQTRSFSQAQVVINGRSYFLNFKQPLRTVNRVDLGRFQQSKLRGATNIDIRLQTEITAVNFQSVDTNRGPFRYRYLVGADGANSLVRRFLNLPFKPYLALCQSIPQITHALLAVMDTAGLDLGYLWSFPHQTYTNVGVGYDPALISRLRALGFLKNYLVKGGYSFFDHKLQGGVLNCSYRGCVFGRIFLAGEAAGLTSAATGEGISYALSSGAEIAYKILEPKYRMPILRRCLKFKRRQERAFNILQKIPGRDNFIRLAPYLFNLGFSQSIFGFCNSPAASTPREC